MFLLAIAARALFPLLMVSSHDGVLGITNRELVATLVSGRFHGGEFVPTLHGLHVMIVGRAMIETTVIHEPLFS